MLSNKYYRLNKCAAVLASFKDQKVAPRLNMAHLCYDKLLEENRELIILFWMLIEDKYILEDFQYKAYCRHPTVDFSYMGDFCGDLLRYLHKRYLDKFSSDPNPGDCWNLPRVNSILRRLPPEKLKYYKDKFIYELFKKSTLYEPDENL